jgi:hypothetical protein
MAEGVPKKVKGDGDDKAKSSWTGGILVEGVNEEKVMGDDNDNDDDEVEGGGATGGGGVDIF